MALNVAGTATPPESGADATEGGERPDLRQLDPDTPQRSGASATRILTGVARAGINLSYVILGILSGTIVLLFGVLLWLDSSVGSDVNRAYAQVGRTADFGAAMNVLTGLQRLSDDLRHARDDGATPMSGASAANEAAMLSLLTGLPGVTAAQRATLAARDPVPGDAAARAAALDACLSTLDALREPALRSASAASGEQVAQTIADRILAHRQAILAFWLQAAQLILLNLLLPLLTALFGYIFGTQQAQRDGSG